MRLKLASRVGDGNSERAGMRELPSVKRPRRGVVRQGRRSVSSRVAVKRLLTQR